MAQENKEELLKKIAVLENKLLEQFEQLKELQQVKEELKSFRKSNEEIAANEMSIRNRNEKLNEELNQNKKLFDAKTKEVEGLKTELTRLANLFDEYIVAYQDQVKMLSVFVKNSQNIEQLLSRKIEEYNKGDKK